MVYQARGGECLTEGEPHGNVDSQKDEEGDQGAGIITRGGAIKKGWDHEGQEFNGKQTPTHTGKQGNFEWKRTSDQEAGLRSRTSEENPDTGKQKTEASFPASFTASPERSRKRKAPKTPKQYFSKTKRGLQKRNSCQKWNKGGKPRKRQNAKTLFTTAVFRR